MTLPQLLALLASLVVLRVTVLVVLTFREYLPPDFSSDFLDGREASFFGSYQWAFYPHIVSGPCTLILGLLLVSNPVRSKWPALHRRIGRIQVLLVLFLVVPSGFWMAFFTQAGAGAGAAFGSLAVATGLCAALGWRNAVNRRFLQHRRWMWRCFLLLCSAVVLRILGGLATMAELNPDRTYPVTAWLSWLLPLVVFELIPQQKNRAASV